MILPRHNSEPDWINKSESDILPTEICMARKLENQVTHIQEVVILPCPDPFPFSFPHTDPFLPPASPNRFPNWPSTHFFQRTCFLHTLVLNWALYCPGWERDGQGNTGTILHSHEVFEIETRNGLVCVAYCLLNETRQEERGITYLCCMTFIQSHEKERDTCRGLNTVFYFFCFAYILFITIKMSLEVSRK